MVELVQIPADEVDGVWNLAEPILSAVIRRGGDIQNEAMKQSLISKARQLWFVWSDHLHGLVVTEIAETPRGKIANIVALGGTDLKSWIHLSEHLEIWARNEGCRAMEIIGRKGWARALPDYDVTQYVLTKRL